MWGDLKPVLVEQLLLFLLPPLWSWHPGGGDASGTMLPLEPLLICNLDLPGGGYGYLSATLLPLLCEAAEERGLGGHFV